MSEATHYDRRRFIGTAVTAIAGAGLVASRLGASGSWSRDTSRRVGTMLGPIRQTGTGAPSVRYAEAGPSDGPAAILLHGESVGINSDIDVAPLAAAGYRVIVPYVRGLDQRVESSVTMRPGQQTIAPSDVIALMAALKIEKALVGGLGESPRTAEVMAALWPQRLKGIVPVSDSGVVTLSANQRPLPPKEELQWWYQYYFLRDGIG